MLHPAKTDPFRVHFKFHMGAAFANFKLRRDLFGGVLLSVISTVIQSAFELSTMADWNEHPVKLILSYLIPAILILAGDAALKAIKALIKTCRVPRFGDYAKVFCFVIFMTFIWAFVLWLDIYKSSPHMQLLVGGETGTPPKYIYQISDLAGFPRTGELAGFNGLLASIFFERISAYNAGVASKCTNWRLEAKLPDGEKIIGKPWYGDSRFEDYNHNQTVAASSISLLTRTKTVLGKRQFITGWVEFYFKNIRKETLRQTGTDLKIACDDDVGKEVSTHQKVEAAESPFRLPFVH